MPHPAPSPAPLSRKSHRTLILLCNAESAISALRDTCESLRRRTEGLSSSLAQSEREVSRLRLLLRAAEDRAQRDMRTIHRLSLRLADLDIDLEGEARAEQAAQPLAPAPQPRVSADGKVQMADSTATVLKELRTAIEAAAPPAPVATPQPVARAVHAAKTLARPARSLDGPARPHPKPSARKLAARPSRKAARGKAA